MPVLARVALVLLMMFAVVLVGQGAQQVQHDLEWAPGTLSWFAVTKISAGLAFGLFAWTRWRRLRRERDTAEATHRNLPGVRFSANTNPSLQAAALLMMIGLTLALLFGPDMNLPGQKIWGVLFVLMTIYLAVLLVQSQRHDGPALVMDDTGLDHMWFGRVPWDQVHGIGMVEESIRVRGTTQRIPVLVLGASFPDRYYEHAPMTARLMLERPVALGDRYGDLRIPLAPLDERPALVLHTATRLRSAVSPPMLPGWRAEMTDAEVRRLVAQVRDAAASAVPDRG